MIEIQLTRGYTTTIDDEDADLSSLKWHVNINHGNAYAARDYRVKKGRQSLERMHRVILGRILERQLERSELVDHKDGDGLNNRRSNLRLATKQQNGANIRVPKNNTSGVRGVYRKSHGEGWEASITHNNQRFNLGTFKDFNDAVNARRKAEIELHGEFSPLQSRASETKAES